jgi:ZIP family zinc transporter
MEQNLPTVWDTALAATITMLSTGLGALPFVFVRGFSDRLNRWGWAAAGGTMLSASIFTLIFPGIQIGNITSVAVGISFGTLVMVLTSLWVDRHNYHIEGISQAGGRRIILILTSIFIHNFPEGVAVGVAFGSGETNLGILMAVSISIHNIPEGLALAFPLRAEGVSGWKCVGWAIFSSMPQVVAAIPAYLMVVALKPILPYAFGFAAGAMIYLVLSEMIPDGSFTARQRLSSAVAAIIGFLFILGLQNVLVY